MLSWLFKRELVDHRVEIVTDLTKFDPSGRTHHIIGDKGFTACEKEQMFLSHIRNTTKPERVENSHSCSTDLDAFPDRGRLVTMFHSLSCAICRWRPHTRSLQSESLRHPPLRPSVCTLFHCHLTTYNWRRPGRIVTDQSLEVAKWCDVALGNT